MTQPPLSDLVDELFTAWSSGDPDQVGEHFRPDAALWDSVNGWFRGWNEIRALYVASLERWDDLATRATRFWSADGGSIAFTWTMSGRVSDDRFGADYRGRLATFDGMAHITFADGLVLEEIEYFDRAGAASSLGLEIEMLRYRTREIRSESR